MIDRAKFDRLSFDLEQRHAALRGVDDLCHQTREQIGQLEGSLLTREFVGWSAAELAGVRVDRALTRDSHPRGSHEARRVHDLDVALRIAALRERLAELQRRSEAAAAELAPLHQLVQRCRQYAEGN